MISVYINSSSAFLTALKKEKEDSFLSSLSEDDESLLKRTEFDKDNIDDSCNDFSKFEGDDAVEFNSEMGNGDELTCMGELDKVTVLPKIQALRKICNCGTINGFLSSAQQQFDDAPKPCSSISSTTTPDPASTSIGSIVDKDEETCRDSAALQSFKEFLDRSGPPAVAPPVVRSIIVPHVDVSSSTLNCVDKKKEKELYTSEQLCNHSSKLMVG